MAQNLLLGGNRVGLTPLDLACGMPLGTRQVDLPPPPPHATLERAIELLCELVFSDDRRVYSIFTGGRESSAHLAVGTGFARRRGYADPIPLTLRHPALDSAAHIENQERVVGHLRLQDWAIVEVSDDLDLIGPAAARVLLGAGLVWPPHLHTLLPLFERSRDGVLNIASGLVDFFAFWRWAPLASVLAGHRRPTPRDVGLFLTTLVPASARARIARRRGIPPPMPWLRPDAERRVLSMLTGRQAHVPLRFDQAALTQVTHRCGSVGLASIDALAALTGATVAQSAASLDLIGTFARAGGWHGFGSQADMLDRIAGHMLPEGALEPRRSPDPSGVYFGERSRGFAAAWSGDGLDPTIIDPVALRKEWLSDQPDWRSAGLLQYAWLIQQISGGSCEVGELRKPGH